MNEFFSPYDADRPLLMKCGCGRDHTVAEHTKELNAQQAIQVLKTRSLTDEFEAYSNEFVEASLIKSLFPQDAVRRNFLRVVVAACLRCQRTSRFQSYRRFFGSVVT